MDSKPLIQTAMAKPNSGESRAVKKKLKYQDVAARATQLHDAALITLFAESLGPIKSQYDLETEVRRPKTLSKGHSDTVIAAKSGGSDVYESNIPHQAVLSIDRDNGLTDLTTETLPSRKRKRLRAEDDIEGKYMSRLAREELQESERREYIVNDRYREKKVISDVENKYISPDTAKDYDSKGKHDDIESSIDIPQHESMVGSKEDLDLEKSSRTVFLANVSTLAIKSKTAKKLLLDHLASFISEIPQQDVTHGVESLRFRSTAFASTGLPKKAAYAKKELMDSTTRSTNAYAVYTTQSAAREAITRLNGTKVLDRHLRVDSVSHPAKIDHRRCIFVGNLGFVDDASSMNAVEDEQNDKPHRKIKEPADVEEGLWKHFGKAGTVESVRVVRDKTTRVGKGFAYVQFENANSVEAALLYHDKKFPPMLPRILRVTRAKSIKKATMGRLKGVVMKRTTRLAATYKPKIPAHIQSLTGRAGKSLGRAGAAQIKAAQDKQVSMPDNAHVNAKTSKSVIFEGYRASRQQGKGVLKKGPHGKKHGKPSARSKDFKAKGRKKV